MDKQLRKYSRVELLELMAELSEAYEEQSREIERLKQGLEAQRKRADEAQRAPRPTKVGSIAEAALKANGYFEAAQRSADDYLREIKRLHDAIQKRAEVKAQPESDTVPIMQDARRQARQSQLKAQEADQLARQAEQTRAQAEHQMRQAQLQAQEALEQTQKAQQEALQAQQARDQAQAQVKQAQAQAKAILDNAQAQADRIVVQANIRAEAIVAAINLNSNGMQGQPIAGVQLDARSSGGMQPVGQALDAPKLSEEVVSSMQSTKQAVKKFLHSNPPGEAKGEAKEKVKVEAKSETKRPASTSPATTAEIILRGRHSRPAVTGS